MEENKKKKNENIEFVFSNESLNQFGKFLYSEIVAYYASIKNDEEDNEKQSEAC